MANALYGLGRQKFLDGSISWSSDNIKLLLVSAGYVKSIDVDEFRSSINSAYIVATSSNLTSKTIALGVAGADDVTFSAVSGNVVTQIVCYEDTGSAATDSLIFCIDTATGLPLTPNGGDISIIWDTGINKIFKL